MIKLEIESGLNYTATFDGHKCRRKPHAGSRDELLFTRVIHTRVTWSIDRHPATARNLFFVMTGEWEVTASDGESRRFGQGSALLVEDTTGTGHSSRVISETDSLAAMMQLA
jgi:hypothetical protein